MKVHSLMHRKAVVTDLLVHTCHDRCEVEGGVLVSLVGSHQMHS